MGGGPTDGKQQPPHPFRDPPQKEECEPGLKELALVHAPRSMYSAGPTYALLYVGDAIRELAAAIWGTKKP